MKRLMPMIIALVILTCACGASPQTTSPETPQTAAPEAPENPETSAPVPSGIDIDITEKMYVTYINDIYTNAPEYLGKMIRIQGMFSCEPYNGKDYYYVYRVGPGCCGNDGSMCGFEFKYDGAMPRENDWIQAVGRLTVETENSEQYLVLDCSSVEIMPTRGKEVVNQ